MELILIAFFMIVMASFRLRRSQTDRRLSHEIPRIIYVQPDRGTSVRTYYDGRLHLYKIDRNECPSGAKAIMAVVAEGATPSARHEKRCLAVMSEQEMDFGKIMVTFDQDRGFQLYAPLVASETGEKTMQIRL